MEVADSVSLLSAEASSLQAPAPLTMQRALPEPTCLTDQEALTWADSFWRDYAERVNAHHADMYFDPQTLYDLLETREGNKPAPVKLPLPYAPTPRR